MTPEEKKQLDTLTQKVNAIDAGFRNLSQLDPQYISLIKSIVNSVIESLKLTDLSDVNTGATNGQVIKWNSSTEEWDPANDIDT